ncbi:MAG: trypsin-like serine protease [Actinomycetota bacterium]
MSVTTAGAAAADEGEPTGAVGEMLEPGAVLTPIARHSPGPQANAQNLDRVDLSAYQPMEHRPARASLAAASSVVADFQRDLDGVEIPAPRELARIHQLLDGRNRGSKAGASAAAGPQGSARLLRNARSELERRVGKIYFTNTEGNRRYCSAATIGRHLVLTAAHCLYNNAAKDGPDGWSTNVFYAPGPDPQRSKRYPMGSAHISNWYVSSPNWRASTAHDIAVLVVRDAGRENGSLGWRWSTTPRSVAPAHAFGYPGHHRDHSRPFHGHMPSGYTTHQVYNSVLKTTRPTLRSKFGPGGVQSGLSGGPYIINLFGNNGSTTDDLNRKARVTGVYKGASYAYQYASPLTREFAVLRNHALDHVNR